MDIQFGDSLSIMLVYIILCWSPNSLQGILRVLSDQLVEKGNIRNITSIAEAIRADGSSSQRLEHHVDVIRIVAAKQHDQLKALLCIVMES
jgi:hypothetical protein